MKRTELAKKEHYVYKSLRAVNSAIEAIKHGRKDHVQTTDQIWPYLIRSLLYDFSLQEYTDGESNQTYLLMSDQEKSVQGGDEGESVKTMDSLFSMGRIFLGGESEKGSVHSPLMRHTDYRMIERFSTFAQNYMIKREWKKRRKSHAQS